ncbi:hypothetical protein CU084_14855 [Bacillus velezensis]|nr:hypothetical protein CU084_14855 [Bacillus velezensis]
MWWPPGFKGTGKNGEACESAAVGSGNFSVHRTYLSGHDILILKKAAELKSAAFFIENTSLCRPYQSK